MCIQRVKAEEQRIKFTSKFLNIGSGSKKYSPIVKTDEKRVMQVLLCLQSNALKFTQRGGSVKIKCKMIRSKCDIDNNEQKHLFDENNQDGMLQISVTDTGIGIKVKDQEKLFKLFGFLDSSKHLNSKGIGLGLHISKKITQ